ncbi:MAG: ABC transporter substrate-binding protein, partial [Gallionellaceae bacterium]|nr:ABC transporter substrate-binding protein [Gallionellaceae bacterium]
GKQLRILARDHRGIPSEGVRNVSALTAMPETLAIVGGKHSNVIMEEMELIHEHSMPYLVPWAASSTLTNNHHSPNCIFRLSVQDQDVAPFLMENAGKGGRKVALLLEQSVWGHSNEEAVKQWALASGKPPVSITWFNRGDKDFTAAIAAIERAGAGAIVVVANSVESTLIANTLAQSERPLPVYSHWGVVGAGFQQSAKDAISKLSWYTISTLPTNPESSMPAAARKLLTQYRKVYGIGREEAIPAFMGAAHAYDLVHLLAAAARKANSTEHKSLRNALEKLANQPGVVHSYPQPFTPQRHDALNHGDLKLVRFDKLGYLIRAD